MSEINNEYITMTDEEGNEFVMEHLDTLEHEGDTFMVFGIVDPDIDEEDDEVAVVVMRAVEQNGEEMLEEVVDDILLEEVYNLFMERIGDEDDELEN